jgi:hypothetical protein
MRTSEMGKILTTAFLGWPHFVVTEPMIRLWCDSFPSITPTEMWDVMRAALKSHTGNFPPTIGQVYATLDRMKGADELTDGEAWGVVTEAVRRFGRYSPGQAREYLRSKGGERLVAAVRSLGWPDICAWRGEDEAANRAHFWRVYSGLRARDEIRSRMAPAIAAKVMPVLEEVAK